MASSQSTAANTQSNTLDMSPNRRSLLDLEEQLSSLFSSLPNAAHGEEKRCPIKLLPALVDSFEKERGIVLLLDEEKGALRDFAAQVDDQELTATELVPFFSMLTKSQSFLPETRRPVSIGSFESDLEQSFNGETLELADQGSVESPQSSPFPRSRSEPQGVDSLAQTKPGFGASRIPRSHARSQTLPQALPLENTASSPLSPGLWTTRQRSAPLDQAPVDTRRPLSRRAATAKARKQTADESLSSSTSSVSGRSNSSYDITTTPITSPDASERASSPFALMQRAESPSLKSGIPRRRQQSFTSGATPTLPTFPRSQSARTVNQDGRPEDEVSPPSAQIHTDSFHEMPKSPMHELDLSSPPANDKSEGPFRVTFENPLGPMPSHDLSRQASTASHSSGHASDGSNSRPASLFVGEGFGNFSLRPDSLASLSNITNVSVDEYTQLIRIVQDSNKRVKELERQNQAQGEDHEQVLVDIQSRLDEAHQEITTRRREEKELRIKEKQSQVTIGTLEAEIAKVQTSLKGQRELYGNTKKQLDEQRVDVDKLRTTIRSKEQDVRSAEGTVYELSSENARLLNEQRALEERLQNLEKELEQAREAHHELELQKIENGKLKDTIDGLRMEVDSLMARIRLSSSSNASLAGSTSVGKGPLRRTLGSEIGGMESDEGKSEEYDSDSTDTEAQHSPAPSQRRKQADGTYERHVIYRTRNVLPGQTLTPKTGAQTTKTTEEEVDAVDEAVQTDTVKLITSTAQTESNDPPPYEGHAKEEEHTNNGHPDLSNDDVWNKWLLDLAMRSRYTSGVVHQIPSELHTFFFKSVTTLACTITLAYFGGVLTGASIFRPVCNHFATSDALWLQYNTFDTFSAPLHNTMQARLSFWFQEFLRRGAESVLRIPT